MSSLEKNLYKRVQSKREGGAAATRSVPNTVYRGLSTVNPENDGFRLYDVAIIKQDLINHFNIRQGEKLENPEFGTIIWEVLYEPLTEALKQVIIEDVETIINSDPRVAVDRVIVDDYFNGLQIECVLTFLDYNISEQLRFQFDEANGLIA
jgi:phage baseplate assembly protein W